MTREEVIALARETGLIEFEPLSWNPEAQSPNPESLAAVWKLCELAAAAEREACARVCEVHGSMAKHAVWMAEECAALIRARGER